MAADLTTIVERLRDVCGLPATIEHPGCIVLQAQDGGAWWFGTANEMWGADYVDAAGEIDLARGLELPISSGEPSAAQVAILIGLSLSIEWAKLGRCIRCGVQVEADAMTCAGCTDKGGRV